MLGKMHGRLTSGELGIFTRFTRKMLGSTKRRRESRPSWEEEVATAGKQSTHAWNLACKERMLGIFTRFTRKMLGTPKGGVGDREGNK